MAKTLDELASTEIANLYNKKISVFKPEDVAGLVLGELEKTGRYEAIVWAGAKIGLITVRDLLDVEQPEKTKLEGLWKAHGTLVKESTVGGVAAELVRINQRALPVIDNNKPVGIISQVDIVAQLADVESLKKTTVKDILVVPAFTLDHGESVGKARKLMIEKDISHVPITKDGKLVGVVTASELVHTFMSPTTKRAPVSRMGPKSTRFSGPVTSVMDKTPFMVPPTANAFDVAKGLRDHEKSVCVVVDEKGGVLGIVTPRELLSLVGAPLSPPELPITITGIADEDFFD